MDPVLTVQERARIDYGNTLCDAIPSVVSDLRSGGSVADARAALAAWVGDYSGESADYMRAFVDAALKDAIAQAGAMPCPHVSGAIADAYYDYHHVGCDDILPTQNRAEASAVIDAYYDAVSEDHDGVHCADCTEARRAVLKRLAMQEYETIVAEMLADDAYEAGNL